MQIKRAGSYPDNKKSFISLLINAEDTRFYDRAQIFLWLFSELSLEFAYQFPIKTIRGISKNAPQTRKGCVLFFVEIH